MDVHLNGVSLIHDRKYFQRTQRNTPFSGHTVVHKGLHDSENVTVTLATHAVMYLRRPGIKNRLSKICFRSITGMKRDITGHHGNCPPSQSIGFVGWVHGDTWVEDSAAGERKRVKALEGKEGVNGGKYREGEMMAIIRIKSVGFGQSRVRSDVCMPTPHPPRLSRAKLQPKSALAHAGSLHDTQADSTWRGNIPNTIQK